MRYTKKKRILITRFMKKKRILKTRFIKKMTYMTHKIKDSKNSI